MNILRPIDLSEVLAVQSPRLMPRPIPLVSRMIGGGSFVLFVALVAQAFLRRNLGIWSVGIAYILYDTALLAFTAWKIWPLGRQVVPPPSSAARPSLGVIIAARNEAAVIGTTLAALVTQNDPPDQILIADDGSDDGIGETLARLYGLAMPAIGDISRSTAGRTELGWLRLPHGGKARALNAAMPRIDTDIVVTVDADTLLDPGAAGAMRRAFAAEPELVAATGVLMPICGPRPVARIFEWFQNYEYIRNFLSRYAWMRLDSLLLISGAFAAFRRDAVLEVGGFDPACLVEDYELIHRLYRHAADSGQDWRIRVIGGALARTDAPAGPLAFLRQRRRWFGGFLQTQHWNRDMVGNRRFGHLGTAMLPVKALDRLQPIYGLVAFAILIFVLVRGHYAIVLPILLVMLAKITIDLGFHVWSLQRYAAWTGRPRQAIVPAVLAALIEPFTFQLLRHLGAAWGWVTFLTGRQAWSRSARTAVNSGIVPVG
jgi:cellulose synthase/poly-beta-1,6-N-acetylglucosamine synthase-like glycosyltransferase